MANVELAESENGLVTLGLPAQLAMVSKTAHEQFLVAHSLPYWKLVVIQIPGTRHLLVFSGGPDNSGAPENSVKPDFALSDAVRLTNQIEEILTLHHEQHNRHVTTASPRSAHVAGQLSP